MNRMFTMLCVAALPANALAQDDFSRLKIKLGDIVYVADAATGIEVSGPLTALSPRTLSIDGYRFEPRSGMTVDRRGDSLWNGALIGFGLGGFVLYPIAPEPGGARGFRPVNALVFAAIGALIDHAHVGRTRIFGGSAPTGSAPAASSTSRSRDR